MASLMDDFCGHMAFVHKPWSGATVQVNVSLKKPVTVGSVLRIHGRIKKKEGRKVHVEAVLDDGGETDAVVYAALEGLSIDGVKLSDHEDEVAERTWEVDVCKISGRLQRQDSGWEKDK
jgi:predicted thioesterase